MKPHHIEPKTHEVYHFDRFGRKISILYTEKAFKRELPDILEHGHINEIQYYVTVYGTSSRALDYYNTYRGA